MAIFASTTTSGYSDPMKAMTIKALEKRQADAMAQNAQQGAITPENTQTPIQGVGHIVNQIAGQMNEGRAMQAAAAQRQALAQTMAGIDWEKGPTSQQIAALGPDPDLMKQVLTTMAENRRQAAQLQHDTEMQQGRQQFEGGQRGEDRAITKAGQEQQGALAREQMGVTKGEGEATRQLTRDMSTQQQNAAANLAQAERDLKASENEKDRAYKGTDRQAQIAADQALEEVKARHQSARDAANNAATASESEKQRTSVKENLTTQLEATKEGQAAKQAFEKSQQDVELAFRSGDRDKIIQAQAARDAAQQAVDKELAKSKLEFDATQPKSPLGQTKRDEDKGLLPKGTFASETAAKPAEVEKTIALSQQQTQRESLVEELKQAKVALDKGVNTGLLKGFDTLRGNLPGGFLGDQAQSQRTELFDSTMKKVATGAMSTILKGASTDYEMQEFVKQYNNPRVSMEDKRMSFERVLRAAEKDAIIGAKAMSQLPEGGPRAEPRASTATAPVDPLEGKIADGPNGPMIRQGGKWVKHGG